MVDDEFMRGRGGGDLRDFAGLPNQSSLPSLLDLILSDRPHNLPYWSTSEQRQPQASSSQSRVSSTLSSLPLWGEHATFVRRTRSSFTDYIWHIFQYISTCPLLRSRRSPPFARFRKFFTRVAFRFPCFLITTCGGWYPTTHHLICLQA